MTTPGAWKMHLNGLHYTQADQRSFRTIAMLYTVLGAVAKASLRQVPKVHEPHRQMLLRSSAPRTTTGRLPGRHRHGSTWLATRSRMGAIGKNPSHLMTLLSHQMMTTTTIPQHW